MSLTKSTPNLTVREAQDGRRWFVFDARGQVLGRLASRVALALRGKNRPTFSPHLDAGDFVVVVNAAEVRLTGRKLQDKTYHRHTGYPGGVRSLTAEEMLAKHPTRLVRFAVEGMLPGNRLGRRLAGKLKVYAGPEHPHGAQRPQAVSLEG
jgi:large subunit ribosomal protein L13